MKLFSYKLRKKKNLFYVSAEIFFPPFIIFFCCIERLKLFFFLIISFFESFLRLFCIFNNFEKLSKIFIAGELIKCHPFWMRQLFKDQFCLYLVHHVISQVWKASLWIRKLIIDFMNDICSDWFHF